MTQTKNGYTGTVKAVDRAFSIIDYLYREGESDMQEIADHLGVAKSTVYKHLNTLKQRGWVIENDHEYQLSYQFLNIGGAIRDRRRLCKVTQQKLGEFAKEVDLMAMFSVLEGTEGVFVYRINDTLGLGRGIPVGVRYDLHQNAAGKSILAEMTDDYISEIISEKGLERQTSHTITDETALYEQIEEIRERGYAINLGERKEQLNAAACAVKDHDEGTIGAISICGPSSRLPEENLHSLGKDLCIVADEINLQIKYG